MSKCDLSLRLSRDSRVYRFGETVEGQLRVRVDERCEVAACYVALVWRTHGKGNKVLVETGRRRVFSGHWEPGQELTYPFRFTVPPGPATYHGQYVNLDWAVTATVDIPWARDPKVEREILVTAEPHELYEFGPEYVPPGRALSSAAVRAKQQVFGGFAFFCLGAFLAAFVPMAGIVMGVFGVVFAGLGAGLFLAALWSGIAQKRLGIPEVRIGADAAGPGEAVPVTLSIRPRKDVTLDGIAITLVGEEVAVSGSGTNKTTHRHTLHESTVQVEPPGRIIPAGELHVVTREVRLPSDAAPTFAASDNEVRWELRVHVAVDQWPDWRQTFPLTVRPC
jgi:hypothetical protein